MTLDVFAFFHLNLMFSSIPEERRPEIVEKAYWPLLELPARIGAPIGIEATGLTLEIAAGLDPRWVDALKAMIAEGSVELVGSGYAQIIAPLTPHPVNRRNLRLGMQVYERMLNRRPKLALVNEQAYAGGLVPLYKEEGYEGILMDWDNLRPFHPEWDERTRFRPQRALGPGGETISLLWTQTMAFQRLQRYAHADIELDAYLETVSEWRSEEPRTLCLYSNDAEIFDVRPKRLHTEDAETQGEWRRIAAAWTELTRAPGIRFLSPSQALAAAPPQGAPIRLETAAYPVPVKKQPKYNVARWAVAGRDNLAVNASCSRIVKALAETSHTGDEVWRRVCRLWSSDFRTHIGDARWTAFRKELAEWERALGTGPQSFPEAHPGATPMGDERWLDVSTPALSVTLNRRRGLAIHAARRAGDQEPPMLVSLMHGRFEDIELQFDWYTGDAVFEEPGSPKIADLDWAQARTWTAGNGDIAVEATVATQKGPVFKRLVLSASEPRVTIDYVFHWPDWGRGSLRAGHFLLNPQAFDFSNLSFACRNGGGMPDRFPFGDRDFDHGAPVSMQVSASTALGVTDGVLSVSDGRRGFRIEIDRSVAPLVAMVQNRQTGAGPFCRIVLSALEMDDTRKPEPGPSPPRHVRYAFVLD